MITEGKLIELLYKKIKDGTDIEREAKAARKRFPTHIVPNYLVGVWYESKGLVEKAEAAFKYCIKIAPLFCNPYFHLNDYYSKQVPDKHPTIEDMLLPLVDKPTFDIKAENLRYSLEDQIKICGCLTPLMKHVVNKRRRFTAMCECIYARLERFESMDEHVLLQGWKNLSCLLGEAYANACDLERAKQAYLGGFKHDVGKDYEIIGLGMEDQKAEMATLNKRLLQGYFSTESCSDFSRNKSVGILDPCNVYPSKVGRPLRDLSGHKIRIGYISPDFNKNATGLFLTPLVKHFDPSMFEVYCYYNHSEYDEYTKTLMSYPGVVWTNIAHLSDDDACSLIKNIHRVDILVDLLATRVGGRTDLIAMKPAPIVMNYLGCPDYSHVKAYDYRLVDHLTDPIEYEDDYKRFSYSEKLVRLPNNFVCYHMFDNVTVPKVEYKNNNDTSIRIGITNRSTKFHPRLMKAWETIARSCPNVIFCVKRELGQIRNALFDGFPDSQVEFVDHCPRMEDFLVLHNTFDMCLDTQPYSGTTASCSALLMGVPIVTCYKATNPHISNVTGSLIKAVEGDSSYLYVADSLDSYVDRVIALCAQKDMLRDNSLRIQRRDAFMTLMCPKKFMHAYESTILHLLSAIEIK